MSQKTNILREKKKKLDSFQSITSNSKSSISYKIKLKNNNIQFYLRNFNFQPRNKAWNIPSGLKMLPVLSCLREDDSFPHFTRQPAKNVYIRYVIWCERLCQVLHQGAIFPSGSGQG